MIKTWMDRQIQRHVDMLNWLAARAKHSWIFSLLMLAWIGWEVLQHVLVPLLAAAVGIFFLWGR